MQQNLLVFLWLFHSNDMTHMSLRPKKQLYFHCGQGHRNKRPPVSAIQIFPSGMIMVLNCGHPAAFFREFTFLCRMNKHDTNFYMDHMGGVQ